MTERIDKILATQLNISRSESKALIKRGLVAVNGKTIKSDNAKCSPQRDELVCRGQKIVYLKYVYIMMNKPKGVISASEGKNEKTVIDILPENMKRKNLFPAGRLDKNTTGFMLITDDGDFAHKILSPANHIEKTYIATLSEPFNDKVTEAFESGMTMDGKRLLSASITPINGNYSLAQVTIKQGLYHQIKRMFGRFHIEVLELRRTKMGNLNLDNSLAEGECRYMTSEELGQILRSDD